MKGMRLFAAVALVLVGQLAFVPRIAIAGVTPDFVVLLVVLIALRSGATTGALLGFAAGLVQGMLAPETLGMDALAKTLLGWSVGKVAPTLAFEGPILYFGLVVVAVLSHDLVYLVCLTRLDVLRLLTFFATHSIPAALYTGAVAALIGGVVSLVLGGVLDRAAEPRRG